MSEPGLPALYRSAPSWGGVRTAAIGTGSFPDVESGRAFLEDACARLRREGFAAVMGPMDGSTWGHYRLPIWSDGSPAFAMEPVGGPHDLAAYQAADFAVVDEHSSATAAPGSRGWGDPGGPIRVASWDGSDLLGVLVEVHKIVMTAFRDTAFFTPIPESAFVSAYSPLLEHADPRFILFARDAEGRPAGFTFAFPDPLRQGALVLKTYAALVRGTGRRMADRIHALAAEAGLREVIHALMRDGIASQAQSREFNGRTFRRYALMGRRL